MFVSRRKIRTMERKIVYLSEDLQSQSKRYWDLKNDFDLLLKYLKVSMYVPSGKEIKKNLML